MKNYKKGVTFMSVVIIIIIISLMTAAIVMTSFNITSRLYLEKFGNEMLQVKGAVNSYITRKSGNIDFKQVEIETSDFNIYQDAQYLTANKEDDDNDGIIQLYEVDLSKIDAESVSYGIKKDGDLKDRYLYSAKTGNIYYEKGFEDSKGKMYYTLTDNLMEILK